jgi:hypothetical protein
VDREVEGGPCCRKGRGARLITQGCISRYSPSARLSACRAPCRDARSCSFPPSAFQHMFGPAARIQMRSPSLEQHVSNVSKTLYRNDTHRRLSALSTVPACPLEILARYHDIEQQTRWRTYICSSLEENRFMAGSF